MRGVPCHTWMAARRVPSWIVKWAALALEFVELERRVLPRVLLQLPPTMGRYTPASAEIEAEVGAARAATPRAALAVC